MFITRGKVLPFRSRSIMFESQFNYHLLIVSPYVRQM